MDEIAIWGDELLERGDPLGEIIAHALRGEDDGEQKRRQSKYEFDHFKVGRGKCVWKQGIIDSIRIETNWGREAMEEITRCPATRFLRVLEFIMVPNEDLAPTDPAPILAERGLPAALRELVFWTRGLETTDISNIYSGIRNVEDLNLWEPARLGKMDLPELRRLRVIHFRRERYVELSGAELPQLSTLAIAGSPWSAFAGFDVPGAPKLETLILNRPPREPHRSGAEWRTLFEAPIAKRARRLHLPDAMGEERELAMFEYLGHLAAYDEVQLPRPRSAELGAALEETLKEKLVWRTFSEPR